MTEISAIDYKDSVRTIVRRRLKEIGIKLPKSKQRTDFKVDNGSYDNPYAVFGVPLERLPSVNVGCNNYIPVPRFLVETTKCLENHLATEGLFRKSGSTARQKQLRRVIESGGSLDDACPHDVACLLKQFFRELPEPLLTNQLHDHFLKCLPLSCKNEQTMAVLFLCILLPMAHLYTLQYFVKFISKVAAKSEQSKMGHANLAIVLAPNLINSNSKKDNHSYGNEKILKDQMQVVEILLENASEIGVIPDDVLNEAKCCVDGNDGGLSSSDELESERYNLRGKSRPTSISAFVTGKVNKFRQSNNRHRRSKSVKVDFSRQKRKVEIKTKSKDDSVLLSDHHDAGEFTGMIKDQKRKPSDAEADKDLTPAGKRKNVNKDFSSHHQCHVISSPFSVSGSTQMFTTPKRPIYRAAPFTENGNKDRSHETPHVMVVDARKYESPEVLQPGEITLEFTKLMGNNTPVGDKYVFASPHTATLSSEMKAKRAKRQGRHKTNRRHSSGATRCFSSSPRIRNKTSKKISPKKEAPLAMEDRNGSSGSTTDENLNLIGDNSVVGTWSRNGEKYTPRKNTPPLPHLKKKPEFRTIFTENVF